MSSQAVVDHSRRMAEMGSATFTDTKRLPSRPNSRNATPDEIRNGQQEVANSPHIGPFNRRIWQRRTQMYRENVFNYQENESEREAYTGLVRDAHQEHANVERVQELAAYRVFTLSMAFPAQPFAMQVFQTVDLAADELPMMEFPDSPFANEFGVRNHAFEGLPFTNYWKSESDVEYLDIGYLTTDRVQFRIWDLQIGNVSVEERVRRQLQIDMDWKIETEAKIVLDASIMTSGLRDTIDLHSSIIVDNVPDVNYLDLNTAFPGFDNILTLPKLKAIMAHLVLMGSLGPTRAVTATAWICSPQQIMDTWEFVDLVSGWDSSAGNVAQPVDPRQTVPQSVRDQIYSTGMMTNAWGYTINWQPNATIPKGRIYILMNQPLGWLFTKSSFDRYYNFNDTNSVKHAIDNYGEMFYRKALRFSVPDMWKYRILIVDL